MNNSRLIKTILFSFVYGFNLLSAILLWFCGLSGNIMLGIILIAVYRLSLWTTPLWITVICWLPSNPKIPARKKLIFNLAHLAICACLFALCRILFGSWF